MTDTMAELTCDTDGRRVSFVLDEEIYPRDAILGAAYLFVDRCWVFLTRPADRRVEVRLTARSAVDEAGLEVLAGEFGNELLNQVMRVRVADSTARLREYTLARAFFAEDNRSSIDALLAELDAEELAEEPLEVAVPWEQEKPAAGSALPNAGSADG